MTQQFVSTHQVESGFQGGPKRSKYPSTFVGVLDEDLEQVLQMDNSSLRVWLALNAYRDGKSLSPEGYMTGMTIRVSQQAIAKMICMSDSSVKRAIKRLEGAGIIRVHRGTFASNRYEVLAFPKAIEQRKNQFDFESYQEYLESQEWQAKRAAALKRAEHRCQICYDKEGILDVHHRTYDQVGNERDTDLTVLCRDCHEWHHRRIQEVA